MTQIVTGKLPKCTFMISDCIAKNGSKKTFVDKIVKLSSSENVYFSLTGASFMMTCLSEYDYWLAINNKRNDFIEGENCIKEFIEVIKLMYKYEVSVYKNSICFGRQRLFFINNGNAIYYDLNFTSKNCYEILDVNYNKQILKENYFINSIITSSHNKIDANIDSDVDSIKEFCFDAIKKIITNTDLQFSDFKNRFTFVLIPNEGAVIDEKPHKYFSDVIANHYGIEYDKIDSEDFKVEI